MRAISLDLKNQDIIFNNEGYLFKPSSEYEIDMSAESTHQLIDSFNYLSKDQSPGSRYRAYLKLLWNKNSNQLTLAEDQKYYQTYDANVLDGGKIREFQILPAEIFHNQTMQKIIAKNIEYIQQCEILKDKKDLIFGIHFIRYHADKGKASYSSPTWLHIDDEPVVFLHLINITKNLIGGDSIIAEKEGLIKTVFRLTNFMDTMIVNRNAKHAVTPMGSFHGVATRDIILFTVEPSSTNGERFL